MLPTCTIPRPSLLYVVERREAAAQVSERQAPLLPFNSPAFRPSLTQVHTQQRGNVAAEQRPIRSQTRTRCAAATMLLHTASLCAARR